MSDPVATTTTAAEEAAATTTTTTTTENNNRRRRTNLYTRARKSFFRSGGKRGDDVVTLRGTHGADFEGNGTIMRVAGDADFCCCFCCRHPYRGRDKKERLLLVKGPFCFVYSIDDTTSPKYAISLCNLQAVVKDQGTTVHVQTLLCGDAQYEINFKEHDMAMEFVSVVTEQSKSAQCDEVRKQLGHTNLVQKHPSIRYAETIAIQKYCKQQPQEPITTKEIYDNIPMPNM